jgi:hypothetical protein
MGLEPVETAARWGRRGGWRPGGDGGRGVGNAIVSDGGGGGAECGVGEVGKAG